MALIVAAEDDTDIADLFAAFLRRGGHTVHTACDGPSALKLVASHRPDLVILDHLMPGLTGLQVARRLRHDTDTAALPLLMLSAAAPAGSEHLVDQVLTKPVTSAQLLQTAQRLLDTPRPVTDPLTDLARLHRVAELLDEPTPYAGAEADLFTSNTAVLLDADTAVINLVLNDAVMIAAAHGLPPLLARTGGVPAEWAPCTTVVRRGRPLLLTDTHTNPEHRRNPAVTVCGIRSYAGVPLRADTGHVIGTLCVTARRPYAFTTDTIDHLTALTPRAMQHLRQRARTE